MRRRASTCSQVRGRWKPLFSATDLRTGTPRPCSRNWRSSRTPTAVLARHLSQICGRRHLHRLLPPLPCSACACSMRPAQHFLVDGAIRYLVTAYDPACQSWPLVPPESEEAPHAPWWNQEGLAERFGNFAVNPRAEVLGYLHEFADETDVQAVTLRDTLTPIVFQDLLQRTEPLSGDAFFCCQRLVDSPGLPSNMAVDLQRWLLRMADSVVATDPTTWSGYVVLPLQVAPNRTAPMGIPLAHVLPANLDYVIDNQARGWFVGANLVLVWCLSGRLAAGGARMARSSDLRTS